MSRLSVLFVSGTEMNSILVSDRSVSHDTSSDKHTQHVGFRKKDLSSTLITYSETGIRQEFYQCQFQRRCMVHVCPMRLTPLDAVHLSCLLHCRRHLSNPSCHL